MPATMRQHGSRSIFSRIPPRYQPLAVPSISRGISYRVVTNGTISLLTGYEHSACHPACHPAWTAPDRCSGGVVYSKLSKLLNQEDALGAPCLQRFVIPVARPGSRGVAFASVCADWEPCDIHLCSCRCFARITFSRVFLEVLAKSFVLRRCSNFYFSRPHKLFRRPASAGCRRCFRIKPFPDTKHDVPRLIR
jgi:hypothetical protein